MLDMKQQLQGLLHSLDFYRRNSGELFSPATSHKAMIFFMGLEAGISAFGPRYHQRYLEEYRYVVRDRGFDITEGYNPLFDMREWGWSESQIIEELFVLAIETWERIAKKIDTYDD